MNIVQKEIVLQARKRGFHLITSEILENIPEIESIQTGILFLLIKHTSASLSINENADSSVRKDFENFFSDIVENKSYFYHTYEGEDDMPAHIKSSIFGVSLHIPITNGKLNLGTWQGIYLCEHRNHGGSRNLVATILY
ncbi:MAG: YjbQ family protein [Leptospiraceae bacterium]|nr:secondary thiamine-phosphate synthase enzyme YjbQ [Leptospiraceae bacterium]MCP5494713.1 YjbQ family protein [Leptospiraceae bacterium]